MAYNVKILTSVEGDVMRKIIVSAIVAAVYAVVFLSCQVERINYLINYIEVDSDSSTVAEFWGLPGIRFVNWRPDIQIKASTDNGNLTGRVWDGTSDINPDTWSMFEYSQIVYYDSDFYSNNIQPAEDATVDNNIIMPLAFEQKIYKRVEDTTIEPNKFDVTWDGINKAVVVQLNTVNSNYLVLKPGARIAIFATQRPKQWGATNDYSIVDSLPKGNCLATFGAAKKQDTTDDRYETRQLSYFTYDGGTMIYPDNSADYASDWFKCVKVEQEKITIYMPYMSNGDDAKGYWDSADVVPIAPFMLFWIAIQQ